LGETVTIGKVRKKGGGRKEVQKKNPSNN